MACCPINIQIFPGPMRTYFLLNPKNKHQVNFHQVKIVFTWLDTVFWKYCLQTDIGRSVLSNWSSNIKFRDFNLLCFEWYDKNIRINIYHSYNYRQSPNAKILTTFRTFSCRHIPILYNLVVRLNFISLFTKCWPQITGLRPNVPDEIRCSSIEIFRRCVPAMDTIRSGFVYVTVS